MTIANLKQLNESLTKLTTSMTETITDIEERGKLRHREYSDVRNTAQEIKKIAQELRVEVLAQFKKQQDSK